MRVEKDFLGQAELADDFPFGIHTWRAAHNFAFGAEHLRPDLFEGLLLVKKAAALANLRAGLLEERLARAIADAADEALADVAAFLPPIHPLQGGAGTSSNMAANELLANLALRRLGLPFGRYDALSPLDHVNLSQSTNDAYPTAVRIALLRGLRRLHQGAEELLAALLAKEKEFAPLLKVGRTELQDAMPIGLGQEFGAWAEAVGRFRWRLDKAAEWLREVNLSGTAVGTGVNADRRYAAFAIAILRDLCREPLTLARNLVDGTQNVDAVVEVSGLVRTGAVAVKKIAADLRLLSSGPHCGLGELRLPPLQAGSSIMPGKVNPVMLEAAEQVCLQVMGGDAVVAAAASESNLELPQFLPLIAHVLLTNFETFAALCGRLAATVAGITADAERLAALLDHSLAAATLLAPLLGHETVAELVRQAGAERRPVLALVRERRLIPEDQLARLLTPEVLAAPGLLFPRDGDER
jgi:aspartate ammonia-lyase